MNDETLESLSNGVDKMSEKVDWLPEKRLKEIRFFREEILTHMIETFDLLNNDDELEAFLAILTEEQRTKLYSHPVLFDSKTNPKGFDLLP